MESVEYLGFLIEVVSPEKGTYEYSLFDMAGKETPEFPLFETDAVEFISYEAAVEDAKSWIHDFLFYDENRAKEHIEKLYATKKALSSSPSMETTGSTAPKLTVDVFNRPYCPEWAKYAAVDENGKAYYFANKPKCYSEGYFRDLGLDAGHFMLIGDFDPSDWQNSLIERPVLQKLTADVFNRSDCPDWVNYAAVNADGKVVLFSDKPFLRGAGWVVTFDRTSVQADLLDAVRFDATDWPNSLIERPKKNILPDWCRDGALGWENGDYFRLEVIDADHQVTMKYLDDGVEESVDAGYIEKHVNQARLRPYNAEEMRGLVGKVLKTSDGDLQLITAYYNDSERVLVGGLVDRAADEIKERYIHLDGSPCGKLVHKEGDDWVE